MGFYRAYKTKGEAKEAAKELRLPRSAGRHGKGYPVNVTVQHIKNFFQDGRSAWGVYIYRYKK